jgi:uncharacterized protein YndB with AHSA1/START domain
MSSFTQTFLINAPANLVWQCLTDPDLIDGWGGGPATMDAKLGTEFELWGGDIWGKNIEVIPHKKLKQEWYAGEWDQPSIVTFEISGSGKQTNVQLTHEQMPENEQKSLEDGWQQYYLGPLKEYVEKSVTTKK